MLRLAVCVGIITVVFSFFGLAAQITGVTWDSDMHVIYITLDSWPGSWDGGAAKLKAMLKTALKHLTWL